MENEIAPLARLHLNRINVIPKSCSDKIITDLMDELAVSENSQDILKRRNNFIWTLKTCTLYTFHALLSTVSVLNIFPFGFFLFFFYQYSAECSVSKYSEWSECNVTCGKGLRSRTRKYLNETVAKLSGCDRQLVSKEMCLSSVPICP